VTVCDSHGRIAQPFRAIDNLARLERRGIITRAMGDAAGSFRTAFQQAQSG
jgi:hypothetical protein